MEFPGIEKKYLEPAIIFRIIMDRRNFLLSSLAAGAVSLVKPLKGLASVPHTSPKPGQGLPVVVSTWNSGLPANEEAWKILGSNGHSLDAVEAGVRIIEDDPENMSVGIGGFPDRDGNITLDACIMDHNGNAGSVCFLQNIKNPVSVARKVMEDTPHVMLAGEGALRFALEKGFVKQDLMTEESRKAWEEWKKESEYQPVINIENHDTIGMVAVDSAGNISGSCTTSGAAFKYHGRVGDSPIIGAGLYVDNEIGGAVATGMGELVMKTLGSFLIVEFMRQGLSPQEACEKGIQRIVDKLPDLSGYQVGYLAINKLGEHGAYSLQQGFNYARMDGSGNRLMDAEYFLR
jgi:isoaspartyl peptidase/L-asparaginase-like protein (Ntn-hydrolase superfamily)